MNVQNASPKKIFVGISGGVDSSVAAYLLKKQGYEVHGVFVKTWSPEWLPCTWQDEKRDAMRVCAALDIPFHFLDGEEAYKQGVADYMIAEYKAGRTPNPDVLCNRVIKFGIMWEYAKAQGAEKIATGHYAQNIDGTLVTAVDASKDQSYFLWMLTNEDLAHILFPIGHLQKTEVRKIAEKAGLFTSIKKDSQGICFLGDVDMREFLSHYIDQKVGAVVDRSGAVVGEHDGVWFYTLGERHGFRITTHDPDRSVYYVVEKDIEKNTLIVDVQPLRQTMKGDTTLMLRNIKWRLKPQKEKSYRSQIRYHGSFIDTYYENEGTVILHSDVVVPLGQSIVVYDGGMCLGGGIVDNIK